MSSNGSHRENGNDDKTDSRGGVKFGSGIAYDDVYGMSSNGGGEYVDSLPTAEEERELLNGGNYNDNIRAKERAEMNDAGRVGAGMHPSTNAKVSSVQWMLGWRVTA